MTPVGELLFWSPPGEPNLSDTLKHNLENEVPAAVDRIPPSDFTEYTDEELVASIADECGALPLQLRWDEAEAHVDETKLVVRDHILGTVTVPGLSVAKTVPFTGDEVYFKLKPDIPDTDPPQGEVQWPYLVVGIEVQESEVEAAVQYIEQTLASVEHCVRRQHDQIDAYHQQLPGVALAAIQRRRVSIRKAAELEDRLSVR